MDEHIRCIELNYRRLRHDQNDADSVWKDDVKKQFFQEFDFLGLERKIIDFRKTLQEIADEVKEIEKEVSV